MPRNGSGTYSPPSNSWNPAVNGVTATANDWQSVLNDLASALSGSVAADGQTSMSGSLDMDGNRVRQLGAPSAPGHSIRWEQFTKGSDIESASDITIPNEGNLFEVTGDTAITTVGDTYPGRTVILRFEAGITLEHSSSLILPGGADITTTAGDMAVFVNTDPGEWTVMSYQQGDNSGDPIFGLRLLRTTLITSTGTFEKLGATKKVYFKIVGGGGGGGGAQGGSGPSAGSGGGAGGIGEGWIDTGDVPASATITIGAGGSAGSAGPNVGGDGGTTSFDSLATATGGTGGENLSNADNSIRARAGGPGGSITYDDAVVEIVRSGQTGEQGGPAMRGSSVGEFSGCGGGTPFGAGGVGRSTGLNQAGADGIGWGSGGGGGIVSNSSTSRAGGAGRGGALYIEEWA